MVWTNKSLIFEMLSIIQINQKPQFWILDLLNGFYFKQVVDFQFILKVRLERLFEENEVNTNSKALTEDDSNIIFFKLFITATQWIKLIRKLKALLITQGRNSLMAGASLLCSHHPFTCFTLLIILCMAIYH